MSEACISLNVLHQFKPGVGDSLSDDVELGTAADWSVSVDPCTGSQDELYVSGNRVVWLNGLDLTCKAVKISYTMESAILQAFWCQFRMSRDEESNEDQQSEDVQTVRGVCVREQECLTLFLQTGAVYYVSLPFKVHHVWPLIGGLLIERALPTDGGYDGLPILFTLLHPSDDLCPVTCRKPTAISTDVIALGFFCDPQQKVLDVWAGGKGKSLVISRNTLSGQHSIWSIQRATQNDIPAHLTTPLKVSAGLVTPHQPLSSSAPNCYGNEPTATPIVMMDTPVEMLLSGTNKNRPGPQQFSLLTKLQKRGSTVKREVDSGTGRSPFINRLRTPYKGSGQTKQSKSLSPHALARVSPFSQAVNSGSWSTVYSEEFSFGRNFDPLIPQACLRLLWRESENNLSNTANAVVTGLHKTTDFTSSQFVVLVLSSLHKLWLLNYTDNKGVPPSFGAMTTLVATQVVPLEGQPMMVLLEPGGGLSLYSGTYKVAVINTSSLYNYCSLAETEPSGDSVAMETNTMSTPSILPEVKVSEIRDPLGNGFTVCLKSGKMFRSLVTQLYRDPAVNMCLLAMRALLPPNVSQEFLANYYTSSHHLPPLMLVEHFEQWLLASLCLPPIHGNPGQLTTDVASSQQSPWQHVQELVHSEKLSTTVPALSLFLSDSNHVGVVRNTLATPTNLCSCLRFHLHTVVLALHLVYEEVKLNTLLYDSLFRLARLLLHVSSCLGLKLYTDHYWRDFPHLAVARHSVAMATTAAEEAIGPSLLPPCPPHLLKWLSLSLRNERVEPFPVIPSVCPRTASVVKLYSLYSLDESKPLAISQLMKTIGSESDGQEQGKFEQLLESSPALCERVVLCLSEELTLADLETLPVGVALPIWESIVKCQECPPPAWPQAAYNIVGRQDVLESLKTRSETSHLRMEDSENCKDGMNTDQEILRLRFPKDLRVNEVRRLLQSSSPVRITLSQKPEVSDHEFLEQQEMHLLSLCQRTMALPVGRGIFTLSSSQPLPTARPAIPVLNLSGRVPPKNSTVTLEHVDKPANMSKWAEFHNGVAAGLKIASEISHLERAWIVYNHPTHENLSNEYAGFLMALGLNGHLTFVPHYELYNLLKEKHELAVIGILLGITANRSGSVNLNLISLLSIYFPPLLPHCAADMEIPPSVQTGAMMGLGFLYLGSANRHIAELMLREIGRTQGPELEFAENLESYSLTAGLSLGMVTLGLGSAPLGLSDLHLVDQLCVFMNGGPKSEVSLPRSAGDGYLVLETEQVNTHITAPGAILALGLMYLKTNDSAVATTLDTPTTLYELDCIRPDFLLLRALSKCLIMWDSVEPSVGWIKDNHIPEIVSQYAFQSGKSQSTPANIDYQTISQAYANIIAGSCMGMGLCFAGTGDMRAHHCMLLCANELLSNMESSASADQAGKHCLERCVVVVVLALAVVMSGSGDLDVLRIIRRLRLKHSEMIYGSHMAVHMALGLLFMGCGRYSLNRSNTSIASLLCSLYPIFPNTSSDNRYHLQAFRHLYICAAEPRVLITRDIKTGKNCSVQVTISSVDGCERKTMTPAIMPEWSSIAKISVCSDSYWPITLDLNAPSQSKLRHNLSRSGCVFVKERPASSQMIEVLRCHDGIRNVRGVVDVPCHAMSGDPILKMLCQQLALPHMQKRSSWSRFLVSALLECVQEEKPQLLTSFLQLENITPNRSIFSDLFTAQTLWQVKLVCAMCHRDNITIIKPDYTEGLLMRFKNRLDECVRLTTGSPEGLDKLAYQYLFSTEGAMATCLNWKEAILLGLTLVLYDIPSPGQVQISRQSFLSDLCANLNSDLVPVTAVVRLLNVVLSSS